MTKDFRGYGGNASETDNYDWWSPVITEPKYNTLDEYTGTYIFPDGSIFSELKVTTNGAVLTMTSAMGSTNLQNNGGDNFYLNEYGAPVIFKRDSNNVLESVYISVQGLELFGKKEGYQYVAPILDLYSPPNPSGGGIDNFVYNGGDMMSGLNDALNAQIAAEIQAKIAADIKANEELAAEAERQRLAELAAKAESERIAKAKADADAKAKAEADAKAKADADSVAKAKADADSVAKAKADAIIAAAEAEKKKLAAIEAQKVADAAKQIADAVKVKTDVVVTPELIVPVTTKTTDIVTTTPTLETSGQIPQASNKPNNSLLIGGILLALVGVYIITKD
jgi:colicin import membrane protein